MATKTQHRAFSSKDLSFYHLRLLAFLCTFIILRAPSTEASCKTTATGKTNCATFTPSTPSLVVDTHDGANVDECQWIQVSASTNNANAQGYSITDLAYSLDGNNTFPISQSSLAVPYDPPAYTMPLELSSPINQTRIYIHYTIPGGNLVPVGAYVNVELICNNDGKVNVYINNGVQISVLKTSGGTTLGQAQNRLHTAAAGGGGSGDPHIRGPSGEQYNFTGQPGGIYSFFSSPWYQVAMELAHTNTTVATDARAMVKAGVVFRNQTFLFNATKSPSLEELKASLGVEGVKVLRSAWNRTEIELCPGHVLTIARKFSVYINIDVSVPGCHDSYNGILGQMFQCKFINGQETFVWSPAQEETFRIPGIFAATGAFLPNATCESLLDGKMETTKRHRQLTKLIGSATFGRKPSD